MNMGIYEKNIEAIKEKDQKLYEKIIGHEECENVLCPRTDYAKNGMPITVIHNGERELYLNSRYNPEAEAKKYLSQYGDIYDYSSVVLLGLSNGIVVSYMLDNLPRHVRFMIYEPSAELFLYAIHEFDFTKLFECERVYILIKGMNDEYMDGILGSLVNRDNYELTYYDSIPVYKHIFASEYDILKKKYEFYIDLTVSNVATAMYFAGKRTENEIKNLKHIITGNLETDFIGVFSKDVPAIVVAAGPSLEKNVKYLKQMKGKALIIAVDSAMKYLVSQGIYPDIVVTADPGKPIHLFEDERVRGIPIAICMDSNSNAVAVMESRRVVLAIAEGAYCDEIYQMFDKHIYSLPAGGSVATFAYALASEWGFKRIVLVGQDLAFGTDKVHAGEEDHDTGKLKDDRIPIEGYYGDIVYTSRDFRRYLDWYEMIVGTEKDTEVINSTEGGAMIHGCKNMPLKEVLEQYCNEEFDFEKILSETPPTLTLEQCEKVIEKWRGSLLRLDDMKSHMEEAIRQIDIELDMIERGKRYKQELMSIHKSIFNHISACQDMSEIYYVNTLAAANTGNILYDIFKAEPDNLKEHCRILEKLRKYVVEMKECIDPVKGWFEELLQETDNETGELVTNE